MEQRKKQMQSDFECQMGLTIDKPKQGYASSNNGYTAIIRFITLSSEAAKM